MPKGRPRQFDTEVAIEKAMKLFWKKGFHGTTIPNLTEALGINRPSLYAAFGSKENLFKLTLDLYRRDPASYVNRALGKPTAHAAFRSLLNGVIDLLTDTKNPGGCLFVCGALASGEASESILEELRRRRIDGEKDIRERFERAVAEGDLPKNTDVKALSRYAATQLWGLSVMGMNGTSKSDLLAAADIAIRAFPGKI